MIKIVKSKYNSRFNFSSRTSTGFIINGLVLIILVIFQLASHDLSSQNYKYPYLNYDSSRKTYKFQIPDILRPKQDGGMKIAASGKGSKSNQRVLQQSDTAKNRIVNLWNDNEVFNVKILLEEYKTPIKIFVINLLGKEVRSVWDNVPNPRGYVYTFDASKPPQLPQGVYLCILQGKNFRHGKKFIVSR